MGKTSQRKRSLFEQGVSDARKYGRGFVLRRGRKDMVNDYYNGVKAGLPTYAPTYSPDYSIYDDYAGTAFDSDINMGLWVGIKRLALLAALVLAILLFTGCSTKTYTSPEGAKITSTTFIYGPELTGLRAQDGNRTLEIEGQKSDLGNALAIIKALTVQP